MCSFTPACPGLQKITAFDELENAEFNVNLGFGGYPAQQM